VGKVTQENLRNLRKARGLTQFDVADILGIAKSAVSKVESGERHLSLPESTLLEWLFFGVVPPRVGSSGLNLQSAIGLSDSEWRVVETIAKADGLTPAAWVGRRIVGILLAMGLPPAGGVAPPLHSAGDIKSSRLA
jgi:transcriptional regulator with XRE-family HTH domain